MYLKTRRFKKKTIIIIKFNVKIILNLNVFNNKYN